MTIDDTESKYNYIGKTNIALFNQYLSIVGLDLDITEKKKEEFGFYFTVLAKRHLLDIEDVGKLIIDDHYLDKVHNIKNTDLGIDAVFIDNENSKIFLYNFKYKETYKAGQIDGSTVSDVSHFLQSLFSLVNKRKKQPLSDKYDLKDYTEKTKCVLKELVEILVDETAKFKIEVVLVANVEKRIVIKNDISRAYKSLGVHEINQIVIDDVYPTIIRKSNLECKIHLVSDEKFTYTENKSKNDTIILPMKIVDLVRISDKRPIFKMDPLAKYNDTKPEFDFLVIDENVRGFIPLNKSAFNSEIIKTLTNDPTLFFLYNNGITIIADNVIETDSHYGGLEYELVNYQVVNGGQTIRSVYQFISETDKWIEHLSKARVLVKIIKIDNKIVRPEKIAEYTNSQNPISTVDIKTIDTLQIQLEKYLNENNIGYVRKVGDYDFDYSHYSKNITMLKLGQLIFSHMGNPHKASNTRSRIFGKDYNNVFNNETIYDIAVNLVNRYHDIRQYYDTKNKVYSEQRLFYVIYLTSKTKRKINSSVELIEKALRTFDNNGVAISDARKLIKGSFKLHLDKMANIDTQIS